MATIRWLLRKNRKIIKGANPYVFLLGCGFLVIYGVVVITGQPLTVPVPDDLDILGYLVAYSGFAITMMYTLDVLVRAVSSFNHRKKKGLRNFLRKRQSLADEIHQRITEAEKG